MSNLNTLLPGAIIRPATQSDLGALNAIEHTCFEHDRLSKRRLRAYISASNAVLLVAAESNDSEAILGYGLILLRRGTQLTRLYSLAILPEARGRKLAKQLIDALEKIALQRGKYFMRLEVSSTNDPAIALYKSLGFSQFGVYPDYYEDHSSAFRMQKRLSPGRYAAQSVYPYYPQTTEFTCGPAALMMAMKATGAKVSLTRNTELMIWRDATTIFMTSGHGGCHPIGLALAALKFGVNSEVLINGQLPLFADGVRSQNKKEVIELVEQSFMTQAEQARINVQFSDWKLEDVLDALKRGDRLLCLISTYAFDRRKAPHWVTITASDESNIYLNDPDAESNDVLDYQHIPISKDDFMRLASYGSRKIRALVILKSS